MQYKGMFWYFFLKKVFTKLRNLKEFPDGSFGSHSVVGAESSKKPILPLQWKTGWFLRGEEKKGVPTSEV